MSFASDSRKTQSNHVLNLETSTVFQAGTMTESSSTRMSPSLPCNCQLLVELQPPEVWFGTRFHQGCQAGPTSQCPGATVLLQLGRGARGKCYNRFAAGLKVTECVKKQLKTLRFYLALQKSLRLTNF